MLKNEKVKNLANSVFKNSFSALLAFVDTSLPKNQLLSLREWVDFGKNILKMEENILKVKFL